MPEPLPEPLPDLARETSVVIPACDAAADLERHLPVLRAEAPEVEVIVVDDGSVDGTAEIAERHGAHVIRQPNGGPASARNSGAREATGSLLVFLDADCRVAPGWLTALLAPLRDPAVVAVKGAYLTDQEARVARLCQVEFEERYEILERAARVDFVDSFSMAIRRDVFLAVGGFDESFRRADNEDVDLSFRLDAAGHRLAFAPRARVSHRHPDSLGRYARLKFSRGYYRARVYERFPGKAVRDSYTPPSLKVQTAAAAVAMAAIAMTPLPALTGRPRASLGLLVAAAAGATAIVATGVPFLARASRRGLSAAPAAAFLIVRASAIAAGVMARVLRLPGPRPKARLRRPPA